MFSRCRDVESVFSENNPDFLPFGSLSADTALSFPRRDGVCDMGGVERDMKEGLESPALGLGVTADCKYDQSTESAVV